MATESLEKRVEKESILRKVRKSISSNFPREDVPLYLESIAAGAATSILVDCMMHQSGLANLDIQKIHQAVCVSLGTLMTPLYYWTLTKPIHSARVISKKMRERKIAFRDKKKKFHLEDRIGLAAGSAMFLGYFLPSMYSQMSQFTGHLVRDYIYPGMRLYNLGGIPYSADQVNIGNVWNMNASLVQLQLLSFSTFASVLVGKMSSMAAGFLTSKDGRKFFSYSLKELYTQFNSKNIFKLQQQHVRENPYLHLSLMRKHLIRGEYDLAFKELEAYMKHPKRDKVNQFVAKVTKGASKSNIYTLEKKLEKKPENLDINLELASRYLSIGIEDNFQSAKHFFRRCSDISEQARDPREIDYGILYALFLESTLDPEKDRQWQRVLPKIVNNEFQVEPIGETSHPVYAKGSSFTRNVILFKEKRVAEGEAEKDATLKIQALLQGHPRYKTVEPVTSLDAIIKGEKKKVYVMKRAEGETLWQKIHRDDDTVYDDMLKITDFLALIHARFPYGERETKEDLFGKVKERLDKHKPKLSEDLQQRLSGNFTPVLKSLEDAIYVFNKDAHPENWLLTKSGVCCIDNDHTDLVPIQCDLVNLMEYGKYVDFEKKKLLIQAYISSYNKYQGKEAIQDEHVFTLGYLNAVIYRSIALSTAWSQPERKTMAEYRNMIVQNALGAINLIEEHHTAFYKEFKEYYIQLSIALSEYANSFTKED